MSKGVQERKLNHLLMLQNIELAALVRRTCVESFAPAPPPDLNSISRSTKLSYITQSRLLYPTRSQEKALECIQWDSEARRSGVLVQENIL